MVRVTSWGFSAERLRDTTTFARAVGLVFFTFVFTFDFDAGTGLRVTFAFAVPFLSVDFTFAAAFVFDFGLDFVFGFDLDFVFDLTAMGSLPANEN